jgi:ATP-binding cassette, subfamily B, multidrug efflux pump
MKRLVKHPTVDVLRQMKRFYWPYRWFWVGSASSMILVILLQLTQPRILGYIVDHVLVGGEEHLILPLVGLVMLVATMRSLLVFAQVRLGERFGIRTVFDLRNSLYDTLQQLSFAFYDTARTGDLMSRVTADVEAVRHFLTHGPNGFLNFGLGLVMGLGMGFTISWRLTLVTALVTPIFAYLVLTFSRAARDRHAKVRLSVAELATTIQESVSGIRTIKSFAREEVQAAKFDAKSEDYSTANQKSALVWAKYFPLLELWAQIGAATVVTYGGYLVIAGKISLGEYVAYLGVQWQIIGPLWNVGGHVNNLTAARAATERLVELLYSPRGVEDGPGARPLPEIAGHVRFEQVSFTYGDGTLVLEAIDLDAPPGKIIGVLGQTGSGKSTLVQLIPRFYDATSGAVTVDGHDVRSVRLGDLRRQIGLVFQESFLFSATIAANIAYGRPEATREEIEHAADLANIHEFIAALPQGYETVVGERGLGLSGGQKQRIAIARAILNNPRILILDDATAAVDAETESEIQKALRTVMEGRTTFIIAHRISALHHADEIIVLENGRVIERGTHRDLLARGGAYRRIYDVQYADRAEVGA